MFTISLRKKEKFFSFFKRFLLLFSSTWPVLMKLPPSSEVTLLRKAEGWSSAETCPQDKNQRKKKIFTSKTKRNKNNNRHVTKDVETALKGLQPTHVTRDRLIRRSCSCQAGRATAGLWTAVSRQRHWNRTTRLSTSRRRARPLISLTLTSTTHKCVRNTQSNETNTGWQLKYLPWDAGRAELWKVGRSRAKRSNTDVDSPGEIKEVFFAHFFPSQEKKKENLCVLT